MHSDRPRIEFVDWLRGIAALLVLLQHSLERASPQFLNWTIKYLNFGIIGVVSFFLISGYVIAHSAGNKPTPVFLINRFFRIFPLYWVVLLLGVMTALFCKEVPNISTVIANLFLIQNYTGFASFVGGSWTLPLELVFYLLFIFRKKIPFFKKNPSAFLFLCLSTGSLIFLRYFLGIQVPLGRILLIHSAFQGTLWYESKFIEKRNESKLHFFFLGATILFYVYLSENATFAPRCILLSWISAYSLFFLFMELRPYIAN